MIGAVVEESLDEYRPLFETNVFGLIELTKAALPHSDGEAASGSSTCRPAQGFPVLGVRILQCK